MLSSLKDKLCGCYLVRSMQVYIGSFLDCRYLLIRAVLSSYGHVHVPSLHTYMYALVGTLE